MSIHRMSDTDFYIEVEDRMGLRQISYGGEEPFGKTLVTYIPYGTVEKNYIKLGNDDYEVEGTVLDTLIDDNYDQKERIEELEADKKVLLFRINLLIKYIVKLEKSLGYEWEHSDKNECIWQQVSREYTGKKDDWLELRLEATNMSDYCEISNKLASLFKEFTEYLETDTHDKQKHKKLEKKFYPYYSEDDDDDNTLSTDYGVPF